MNTLNQIINILLEGNKEAKKKWEVRQGNKAYKNVNFDPKTEKGNKNFSRVSTAFKKGGKAGESKAAARIARNEALAYEIFDIICEGVIKAASKAKRK